jgi:competence protein ComEC
MKVLILLLPLLLLWQLHQRWPSGLLEVTVCDVGQGDAILLSLFSLQLLVDTGPNDAVLLCLEENMPVWDRQLEVLLLTHYDDDHIGGVSALQKNYRLNYVFLPLTEYKTSSVYLEMQQALTKAVEQGTQLKQPFLGQQMVFSKFGLTDQSKYSITCTFLTPERLDAQEQQFLEENQLWLWQKPETNLTISTWDEGRGKISTNDGSIALLCQFGMVKILLTGDLESTRELALVESALLTRVDIQKVGHHGSKSSSSLPFMLAIRPETSLISCGQNNKFEHPHQETLSTLAELGVQLWRTDHDGDIKIISDGDTYWSTNPR